MTSDKFRKSQALPRYTSYPTAPHFHNGVGKAEYKNWLSVLNAEDTLSLYLHIPFCDTLCWFCGCHTKITRQYNPVASYLKSLHREIKAVSSHLSAAPEVVHIHLGGGSPTIMEPEDLKQLTDRLHECFRISGKAEFAIEVDPRDLTEDHAKSLCEAGVNRISIGVQDFDDKVQRAINRIQSYDETGFIVRQFRKNGVKSVNLDILYGLPFQTLTSIEQTLEKVLSLQPERISCFGYAHVPWMKKHQNMISEENLPNADERFEQAEFAANYLTSAGYIRIGIDHFAHPDDPIALKQQTGELRRNFQGYTTDDASAIIGLGASAIGRLPQGYLQNTPAIGRYQEEVDNTGLATLRGLGLTEEDCMRAHIIERIMCDLRFSKSDLRKRFGKDAEPLILEAEELVRSDTEEYLTEDADGFSVTEKGRPLTRMISAHFDAYLKLGKARHSLAV